MCAKQVRTSYEKGGDGWKELMKFGNVGEKVEGEKKEGELFDQKTIMRGPYFNTSVYHKDKRCGNASVDKSYTKQMYRKEGGGVALRNQADPQVTH